jgi:hypothetical protein
VGMNIAETRHIGLAKSVGGYLSQMGMQMHPVIALASLRAKMFKVVWDSGKPCEESLPDRAAVDKLLNELRYEAY